ncbi:hypothetical protein NLM25_14590 [Bradyrhizobium sp. CCGB01]|nr:hypothetical protein [Bradyrhizobium sp. CCGB01]MCP3406769.1 hypothetical protein [Bradyrhizobium sp. CCGB01]
MFAVAMLPAPPKELTTTELVFKPLVVPVTLTVRVQDPPTLRRGFKKIMLPLPAVAVTVVGPALVQDCDRPFGVAMTRPAGMVSVNVTFWAKSAGSVFVTVKVMVVVPFKGIDEVPNAFVMTGIAA